MLPVLWLPFWFTCESRPAPLPGMDTWAWSVDPSALAHLLPSHSKTTQWPLLRAAQAVSKAGLSFLGADLLLNGIHQLRRNDALMATAKEASRCPGAETFAFWIHCLKHFSGKSTRLQHPLTWHYPPASNKHYSEREVRFTGLNLVSKKVAGSLAFCQKNHPGKWESQAMLLAPTYLLFAVHWWHWGS